MIVRKSAFATGTAVVLLMASAGQAHAEAYAVSYLNTTGGFISFSPFANASTGTNSVTSTVSASLNGSGLTSGGAGFTDALPVNAPGSLPLRTTNNLYNQVGPSTGTFANADSNIPTQQFLGDPFTQTLQIAETDLQSPFSANANSENSSVTGFSVTFNVASPTTFAISFYADTYMRSFLDSTSVLGLTALSTMNLVVEIVDSANNLIFRWTPNGGAGGITGGSESADAFSLNRNLPAAFLGDDQISDDGAAGISTAAGTGSPGLGTFVAPTGFGFFSAISDPLAAGTYSLSLSAKTTAAVTAQAVPVPEPGVLALMGIGLAGLGAMRRRRSTRPV